jgi:hypothetical protein
MSNYMIEETRLLLSCFIIIGSKYIIWVWSVPATAVGFYFPGSCAAARLAFLRSFYRVGFVTGGKLFWALPFFNSIGSGDD